MTNYLPEITKSDHAVASHDCKFNHLFDNTLGETDAS
jgi:hypothetical protein